MWRKAGRENQMRFRKKPVVIDAVQFTEGMAKGDESLPGGVAMGSRSLGPPPERKLWHHKHYIETLEANMRVEVGDWIITGVKGEKYPCKPDIFEAPMSRYQIRWRKAERRNDAKDA
jgi:hypothetical protein